MPRHLLLLPFLAAGCADVACSAGADGCTIPSPCKGLAFTCDGGSTEARTIADPSEVPGGVGALGAPGDVLLGNDQVVAVIDALDHPHYLATSGGGLIDLSVRGADDDSMRQVAHTIGLLPDDAAHYTSLEILDEGDVKAVQVVGELAGRPGMRIATRYEVRPCEPGIRVRTELFHGGLDPITVLLSDGWYMGDRGHVPFTPAPGAGFEHPAFGLTSVSDVLVDVPYLVAGAHPAPGATYATVACATDMLDGFHSDIVSVVGTRARVLLPGDFEIYERFVGVSSGPSVAGAADIALEVRRQLFDEAFATLSGTVSAPDDPRVGVDEPGRLQLIIAEGAEDDDPATRVPWSHVVPDADGSWEVRVPAGRTYTLEAQAFGHVVATKQVDVGDAPRTDAGRLDIPSAGEIVLTGPGTDLLVFVQPTTPAETDELTGRFLGTFESCAPLLGHPHGSSPACDRVLVREPTSVLVPPGTYDLHAVRGPFSTVARVQEVTVAAGQSVAVTLEPELVDMMPDGWWSADFHVHGSASFDSAFGDVERVRTFAAADIDVVVTTEHDVVSNLAPVVEDQAFASPIHVIDGTEATGHILFPLYEDASFPKVFGHWNLFPMAYDPAGPYRGAPWDELTEPGGLFERAEALGWPAETGVAQLNHPWGGFQFGRDYGWAETIALDLTKPLSEATEGSGAALFSRVPPGLDTRNDAYHTQEVMNGSANTVFQPYRAVWFYVLEQGLLRAGTANSDTHSLTENVLGFPRTLVRLEPGTDWSQTPFLLAVRDGRMSGTNGPLLEVGVDDGGTTHLPSLTRFTPGAGAELTVKVTAMPWVPVDEVRVIVNGQVARTLTDLTDPDDELDPTPLVRIDTRIALSELLPDGEDAWIVVEAGAPLAENADLDCNGVPDTGDNDGDGDIDIDDVDGDDIEVDADGCLDTVGPLREPTPPERGERGHLFSVVVPRGHAMAFSNPLVVDVDGDGWTRGTP